MKMLKIAVVAIALVAGAWIAFISLTPPRNDRDWALDQVVLPNIEFDRDLVTIRGIRNFKYQSEFEYTPGYYNATFDLAKISSVDYVVEPFSTGGALAHTFLSFGFEDGRHVAISVEIRKEKGEEFSPLKGLFRRYEIMYVIADERDVIGLRANHRKDKVYVYPIKASRQGIRNVFVDMLRRANTLAAQPEFYNSVTNTCTTNIVRHVNEIAPRKIPFNLTILLPGQSDHFVYDLGLIDTDLSFEDARERFLVNERAAKHADSPRFSQLIRSIGLEL